MKKRFTSGIYHVKVLDIISSKNAAENYDRNFLLEHKNNLIATCIKIGVEDQIILISTKDWSFRYFGEKNNLRRDSGGSSWHIVITKKINKNLYRKLIDKTKKNLVEHHSNGDMLSDFVDF